MVIDTLFLLLFLGLVNKIQLLPTALGAVCPPGFRPPDCIHQCPRGHYGLGCASLCPITCITPTCRPDTGKCFRCRPGFQGPKCDFKCDPGRFGQDCLQKCSVNCLKRRCDVFTGACPGCVPGFFGTLCDQVAPESSGINFAHDSSRSGWRYPNSSRLFSAVAELEAEAARVRRLREKDQDERQSFFTAITLVSAILPICLVGACLYLLREKIQKMYSGLLKRKRWAATRDGFFTKTIIPRSKSRFIPKKSMGLYSAPVSHKNLSTDAENNHDVKLQEKEAIDIPPSSRELHTLVKWSNERAGRKRLSLPACDEQQNTEDQFAQEFAKEDVSVLDVDIDTTVPLGYLDTKRGGFSLKKISVWRKFLHKVLRWRRHEFLPQQMAIKRLCEPDTGNSARFHATLNPRAEETPENPEGDANCSDQDTTDSSTTASSSSTSSQVLVQEIGCNTEANLREQTSFLQQVGVAESEKRVKTTKDEPNLQRQHGYEEPVSKNQLINSLEHLKTVYAEGQLYDINSFKSLSPSKRWIGVKQKMAHMFKGVLGKKPSDKLTSQLKNMGGDMYKLGNCETRFYHSPPKNLSEVTRPCDGCRRVPDDIRYVQTVLDHIKTILEVRSSPNEQITTSNRIPEDEEEETNFHKDDAAQGDAESHLRPWNYLFSAGQGLGLPHTTDKLTKTNLAKLNCFPKADKLIQSYETSNTIRNVANFSSTTHNMFRDRRLQQKATDETLNHLHFSAQESGDGGVPSVLEVNNERWGTSNNKKSDKILFASEEAECTDQCADAIIKCERGQSPGQIRWFDCDTQTDTVENELKTCRLADETVIAQNCKENVSSTPNFEGSDYFPRTESDDDAMVHPTVLPTVRQDEKPPKQSMEKGGEEHDESLKSAKWNKCSVGADFTHEKLTPQDSSVEIIFEAKSCPMVFVDFNKNVSPKNNSFVNHKKEVDVLKGSALPRPATHLEMTAEESKCRPPSHFCRSHPRNESFKMSPLQVKEDNHTFNCRKPAISEFNLLTQSTLAMKANISCSSTLPSEGFTSKPSSAEKDRVCSKEESCLAAGLLEMKSESPNTSKRERRTEQLSGAKATDGQPQPRDSILGLPTIDSSAGIEKSHQINTVNSNSFATSQEKQTLITAAQLKGQNAMVFSAKRASKASSVWKDSCVVVNEYRIPRDFRITRYGHPSTQTQLQSQHKRITNALSKGYNGCKNREREQISTKEASVRCLHSHLTLDKNFPDLTQEILSSESFEEFKSCRRGVCTEIIEISETSWSASTQELTPSNQKQTLRDCSSLSAKKEMSSADYSMQFKDIQLNITCETQNQMPRKLSPKKTKHFSSESACTINSKSHNNDVQKDSHEKNKYPLPTLLENSLHHGDRGSKPSEHVMDEAFKKACRPAGTYAVKGSVEMFAPSGMTVKDSEDFNSIEETSSERFYDALETTKSIVLRQPQILRSPNVVHGRSRRDKANKMYGFAPENSSPFPKRYRSNSQPVEQHRSDSRSHSRLRFMKDSDLKPENQERHAKYQNHQAGISFRFARPKNTKSFSDRGEHLRTKDIRGIKFPCHKHRSQSYHKKKDSALGLKSKAMHTTGEKPQTVR
ncbi:multiple epidermal growth factor-like domains 6 [Plakobranchus ocellatus]|uniref:Multiple epidermal growth factor-like domains 6 n=1 Tax=Plakobranchus ocellatus TaxID=259542 RepID=A0AAV4A929_9GAST|nr:multiple epidermal growth factor-like domains 6 [Plakobranchus ocellatus]